MLESSRTSPRHRGSSSTILKPFVLALALRLVLDSITGVKSSDVIKSLSNPEYNRCSVLPDVEAHWAMLQKSLDGTVLPAPTLVNALGILIDSGLTFSAHIDKITSKAFQRSYLIRKCFRSRDTNILLKAFKTYVRPLVEGNSAVWSPHIIALGR